jgi:hypothetical protein
MPSLTQSLSDQDLGHLRIIAELWGVELDYPDERTALPVLVKSMLNADTVEEIVGTLMPEAQDALEFLFNSYGRLSWALFTRRCGVVREMGPGRRDRERPYRTPAGPAEVLWYRGLVGRAFFDTPSGPQEFAYIPSDLIPLLPFEPPLLVPPEGGDRDEIGATLTLGRPATPKERAYIMPANDKILDHACTYLAALRTGLIMPDDYRGLDLDQWIKPFSLDFIKSLLKEAKLVGNDGIPDPETVRDFLGAGRGEALALIAKTWIRSANHDDLRLMPNIETEGEWENDPLRTRRFISNSLNSVPAGTWWSLSAFVADVSSSHPDFQRPAGDYDSWFIRDKGTGEYLRGVEHWDDIDGALLRHMVSGPFYWLGIMELASPEEDVPVTAFRFSEHAQDLITGRTPVGFAEETGRLHVRSDGRISVPNLVPRSVRYQLARFCLWEDPTPFEYRYRVTPASLQRARASGLRINHLLSLLKRHADHTPPNVSRALIRWDEHGTEARLEDVVVLRLSSPKLLDSLRKSRAARFLGNPLGPTTVVVKPGAGEKVLGILAEMGYLGESARIED